MAFHGKGSAVTQDSQSFGVRLDAQTLERLDAYAGRAARKRGWAAARAIAAGLDALDGVAAPPPSPGSNPAPSAGTPEANDARALAGALYDMLAPQLVDAVAAGVRRGQRPEIASVGVIGVARVVDALRAASESASDLPDGAARARLAVAVSDAIAMLTVGPDAAFRDGPHGGALAAALDGRQPSPSPPPTPRPAGRRRARAGAEP